MSAKTQFISLVNKFGSEVTFHREQGGTACPCLSPEGYRDMKWHRDHPEAPICNEQGRLDPTITEIVGKAFVQPVQSGATRRLTADYAFLLFGEVQQDDHVGIFPDTFQNTTLDFEEWDQSGEDFILYNGRRYMVVNVNRIPAPDTGLLHHYETGLRLIKSERPTDG